MRRQKANRINGINLPGFPPKPSTPKAVFKSPARTSSLAQQGCQGTSRLRRARHTQASPSCNKVAAKTYHRRQLIKTDDVSHVTRARREKKRPSVRPGARWGSESAGDERAVVSHLTGSFLNFCDSAASFSPSSVPGGRDRPLLASVP